MAKGYSTDLDDEQWELIKRLIPQAKTGGRPRTTDPRQVVNAILYVVKEGVHWRSSPRDFPPWQTVYTYFKNWGGRTNTIMHDLVKQVRVKEGGKRGKKPTIAIMDSQSVRTGKMVSEHKGYDGGKHVKGRKRHIAVDSGGLPLGIHVTAANTHDKVGGAKIIENLSKLKYGRFKRVFVDGGYQGKPFRRLVKSVLNARVKISKGIGKRFKGFKPIKNRWAVERTFAWLGDYRRLTRDHERKVLNSKVMIRWAFIRLMLRRLSVPLDTAWG